jgi:hypothetical protein
LDKNVSLDLATNLGTSNPINALLIPFLEKISPKLLATTKAIFFAKTAVAACPLELPHP